MPERPLSPGELERLARLAAMPDDDIDLPDIPEMTDEAWAQAVRLRITISPSVVMWFKAHAPDGEYPAEINRVLREYVAEAKRRA